MKITRRATRAEVPAMAMGDIAFNLIVFFVILARAQDDSNVKWVPARVSQLEQGKLSRVSVVINHKNKVFLNGNETGTTNLAAQIEARLAGVTGKDRVVQFKIHKDAPVSVIGRIFVAIGEAGAEAFVILEKE